ncbi:MAG: hypothetical protein ABIS59_01000 [Candidatus Saccharibacteria bacterium]
MTRDNAWLQQLLDTTWDSYFSDVAQDNDVRILFGRRAKRRLGSISLDPSDRTISIITMNGIFRSPEIPEFVIQATLVHEMTHYAQGFNSPLAQAQAHPHAGGVMKREFTERGLLELYLTQKRWLKVNWPSVLAREFPAKAIMRKTSGLPKGIWFLGK